MLSCTHLFVFFSLFFKNLSRELPRILNYTDDCIAIIMSLAVPGIVFLFKKTHKKTKPPGVFTIETNEISKAGNSLKTPVFSTRSVHAFF